MTTKIQTLLPLLGCAALLSHAGASTAEAIPLASRIQAAKTTAVQNQYCQGIAPFYWEIGDQNQLLAGGTEGGAEPRRDTQMKIASASKWLFGAYLVQRREGKLSAADIKALTMKTGYTDFRYGSCIKLLPGRQAAETVNDCLQAGSNNHYNAADDGYFYYNGGHFQQYAVNAMQLGGMNDQGLTAAVVKELGDGFAFSYASPQLAGGVSTTAGDYARFLQHILAGKLLMREALGSNAVCTNPKTCAQAISTPVPEDESWHYSMGHWVEDDPKVGDGAFSSPGAFGFYPWIDGQKTYYGIVARYDLSPLAYYRSVQCGRDIRKAWAEGAYVPAD